MEGAGAAVLLPSGHLIHSIINDAMDLCVWLQILLVLEVRPICYRVSSAFSLLLFFLQ